MTELVPSIDKFTGQIHQGHILDVLKRIPGSSIDLVLTSPPYFGLRDYRKADAAWDDWTGQLGLEPDFKLYVKHLVQVFHETRRVLKKTGSIYVVLGDTYAGGGGVEGKPEDWQDLHNDEAYPQHPPAKHTSLPSKSLIGVPWRCALAMIDDGWILRNCIIWSKPNHMPSSVKDRLSNSYEFIFHFVQAQRYYYDLDSIRKPHQTQGQMAYRKALWAGRGENIANQFSKAKRYKGKFAQGEVDPETLNSPRARLTRLKEIGGLVRPGQASAGLYDSVRNITTSDERLNTPRFYHEKGKNPGDVFQPDDFPVNPPHTSYGTRRHVTGSMYARDQPGHPAGKNPGDVMETTKGLNVPGQEPQHGLRFSGHQGDWSHLKGPNPGDMWRITTRGFPGAHFAVFPLNLCFPIITSSCPRDGIVMDIFGGAGTVAEAVEILNRTGHVPSKYELERIKITATTKPLVWSATRKWVLVEISTDYVEIARKRLAPYG